METIVDQGCFILKLRSHITISKTLYICDHINSSIRFPTFSMLLNCPNLIVYISKAVSSKRLACSQEHAAKVVVFLNYIHNTSLKIESTAQKRNLIKRYRDSETNSCIIMINLGHQYKWSRKDEANGPRQVKK